VCIASCVNRREGEGLVCKAQSSQTASCRLHSVRAAHEAAVCALCRADLIVNTEKEDLVQRSREATKGRGAYTSLDPVAGTFTDTVSAYLR
jgi:NADPH:quinone reductase-like Zn-dependent oxidoreductase